MKSLVLAVLATFSAANLSVAALLAHVETTAGTITVELQYAKTPLAVANFITLAEGTRPHIDPDTGAISNEPYYVGESFYRVVNTSSFKIAQTGSGTGTNSGGPGYTFRDEFDPSLRHVPYVLSMANSGPNTNGSQIFFVGNSTPSHLDDVHTVFGLVTDIPSQAVIDAIHNAGNDGSSITGITFARTDPAAQAFDELAQPLPEILPATGTLEVAAGQYSRFQLAEPATAGDIIHVARSEDLAAWQPLATTHVGIGPLLSPPSVSEVDLDDATLPRAFYHLAVARHPNSFAPSNFKSRTLQVSFSSETHLYLFDATGGAGVIEIYSGPPTGTPYLTRNFTVFSVSTGAHHSSLIAETNISYGGMPFTPRIQSGWDSSTSSAASGRQTTTYYDYFETNPNLVWKPYGAGTCAVTR